MNTDDYDGYYFYKYNNVLLLAESYPSGKIPVHLVSLPRDLLDLISTSYVVPTVCIYTSTHTHTII